MTLKNDSTEVAIQAIRDASQAACYCVGAAKTLIALASQQPYAELPGLVAKTVDGLDSQLRTTWPLLDAADADLALDCDPPGPIGNVFERTYARMGYVIAQRIFFGVYRAADPRMEGASLAGEDNRLHSQIIADNLGKVRRYLLDGVGAFDADQLSCDIRREAGMGRAAAGFGARRGGGGIR